jgi:uncharacterized membrane protein
MRVALRKELWNALIVALPFVYLILIWNQLPEIVPMHWNMDGEVDRYAPKIGLWMIPILLPFFTYIIFLITPMISVHGQFRNRELKYERLKFSMVLLTSVIASYILFAVKEQTIHLPKIVLGLIGLLFAVLGHYFPIIKRNTYIGIKTPWTLKSDMVWDKTHRMAGKYWFFGGVLTVICNLFLEPSLTVPIFLGITFIITVIPMAYSYTCYQKIKQSN